MPFLLRTGKRLAFSRQRVSLILREPDGHARRRAEARQRPRLRPQRQRRDRAAPGGQAPGPELDLDVADIDLPLDSLPDGDPLPPYVRLIHDVLVGDRSLFTRPDGLAAVWEAAGPLLDHPPKPQPYAPGSWGPEAARELAEPDGWLLGQ